MLSSIEYDEHGFVIKLGGLEITGRSSFVCGEGDVGWHLFVCNDRPLALLLSSDAVTGVIKIIGSSILGTNAIFAKDIIDAKKVKGLEVNTISGYFEDHIVVSRLDSTADNKIIFIDPTTESIIKDVLSLEVTSAVVNRHPMLEIPIIVNQSVFANKNTVAGSCKITEESCRLYFEDGRVCDALLDNNFEWSKETVNCILIFENNNITENNIILCNHVHSIALINSSTVDVKKHIEDVSDHIDIKTFSLPKEKKYVVQLSSIIEPIVKVTGNLDDRDYVFKFSVNADELVLTHDSVSTSVEEKFPYKDILVAQNDLEWGVVRIVIRTEDGYQHRVYETMRVVGMETEHDLIVVTGVRNFKHSDEPVYVSADNTNRSTQVLSLVEFKNMNENNIKGI